MQVSVWGLPSFVCLTVCVCVTPARGEMDCLSIVFVLRRVLLILLSCCQYLSWSSSHWFGGTWQKWPGHVFFLCRCLLINNPFLPRPPITPLNDFLIKLSIRFCGRTAWLNGRTTRRVMRLEGSASRAPSGCHVSDDWPPLATWWSFLKWLVQCWDEAIRCLKGHHFGFNYLQY